MIENKEKGYFYPQNSEYVKTTRLVELIAKTAGKNIITTKIFNPIISVMKKNKLVNKVFGNMYYEKEMSIYHKDYNCVSFEESILRTESK